MSGLRPARPESHRRAAPGSKGAHPTMSTTQQALPLAPRRDDAPVTVPTTHRQAVALAEALADAARPGAIERDRTGALPVDLLDDVRRSGLLTLVVPQADGGPGASHRTITRVFATLAAADPAFAQVPQPHFSFSDTLSRYGGDEARALILGDVLRGARLGNALSERGAKHAFDLKTRLTRTADGGLVLNGVKYYSTGAFGADWIGIFAIDDDGEPAIAYIPRDAPGLEVGQDWNAFGQRSTISGSTVLTDVPVAPELVVRGFVERDGVATTVGAYAQLLHVALDVGIARGALQDGLRFTREVARPWPAAGVDRPADEQGVQALFGRLETLVEAAELYLDHAAGLMDDAREEPTAERIAAARLGVAKAKAFAVETVLEVTTGVFDGSGSSAVDVRHGLDRHWRNARTHTLHDPNRWKYIHIGRWALDGVAPPIDDHSL